MDKMLQSLAQDTGLRYDEKADAVFGVYGGYHVCVSPQNDNRNFFVASFSVGHGGIAPDKEAFKPLVKSCRQIARCDVQQYGVTVTAKPNGWSRKKSMANAKTALEETVAYLRRDGYADCCQSCGHELPSASYMVNGAYKHLCSQCGESLNMQAAQMQYQEQQKSENVIGGVVGAFLGSLLGVLVMVILDRLGYVAALSGIVLAICSLKGYELLGGKIGKLGTVLSILIMLVMVYIGNRVTWAITAVTELGDYWGINFFDCFRYLPDILEMAGEEARNSYIGSLVLQYLFVALGAVPTLISSGKNRKLKNAVLRLGSTVE